MIRADGLRKSYGATVAVDGLSFEVAEGETFGLLGPNGAGKSTTIHLLSGLLRPDAGIVALADAVDPTRPEVRRSLGIAPQTLSLYEKLTAEENLRFFGRMYDLGGKALTQRVDFALALAGLADRRRDRVSTFSGGMKRRLNLACALIHDPKMLFLDEPTAGVDPQSRNHLFESIEELARQGRTVLYTTHYMEEAQRLCRRVAVVDRGKLLALDTVPNLLARYGGRAVVEVELGGAVPPEATLPVKPEGNRLRFESDAPLDELVKLRGAGVPIASFRVDQPDLETVFLTLTGRRLRD